MLVLKKIVSSDALFDEAWKVVNASFPEDERRSLPVHKEVEKDPRYEFCAILSNNTCVGALGLWRFTSFIMMEHLAVVSSARSLGVGSDVMSELLGSASVPVVIEVEPAVSGAEAIRRIFFYRSLGFIANEYDYYQPAYETGKKPVPMLLMTYPVAMSNARLDSIRATIYAEVYRVISTMK